jgi:hypothetical protein
MKKFIAISFICGALLSVAACSANNSSADYNYENQAPYASERTVGGEQMQSAEPVFSKKQHK